MLGVLRRFFSAEKRVQEVENAVANSFSNLKEDTGKLVLWIRHFHEKDIRNDEFHTNVTEHIYSHHDRIESLEMQLDELRKMLEDTQGQLRTSERTSKDMSLEDKKDIKPAKKQQVFVVESSENLAAAHQEVVNILYNADRPLSYYDIAKATSKKEKSVRNLIYEIRKKGYDIKDKNVGLREKGFYFENEEKIRISGR